MDAIASTPPPAHEPFGERVAAVNSAETRASYVARQKIHTKEVHGDFRRLKWRLMAVLLAIYYLTPWIRYPRGAGVPDQAVLVDLDHSRFYFFMIKIWPQEIYLVTGLLILGALGLFLVTAILGRVWCGYACPQTVWTDLFMKVEAWIEGDRGARIRLDAAPMSLSKFAKRVTKHVLWLVIAMATGGAWIFYFADAPTLARQFFVGDAPAVAYSTFAVLTATTYLFASYFREQVCTYMCPYSRFQGAMMDPDTYTVTYKFDRGEPRGAYRKHENFEGRGDCIDCTQCVAACPAGIDIRDGQQLECITCGLCIDACDEVMDKIARPRGLIGYDTLANLNRRQAGMPESHDPIRTRTIIYVTLMLVVGSIMALALYARPPTALTVLHDRDPLFVVNGDGSVRNGYTLKIANKAFTPMRYVVTLSGLEGANLWIVGETSHQDEGLEVEVPPDQLRAFRVLVRQPAGAQREAASPFEIIVTDLATQATTRVATTFRRPS